MIKMIFHGGASGKVNTAKWYQFLTGELQAGQRLLDVYFASPDPPEVIQQFIDEHLALISPYFNGRQPTVADPVTFLEQIRDHDLIYFHGGDTFHLLKQLEKYPGLAESLQGKTVAGASAGAYALCENFYSNDEARIAQGLGIAKVNLICHYQPEKHSKIIRELMTYAENDLPLFALPEGYFITLDI